MVAWCHRDRRSGRSAFALSWQTGCRIGALVRNVDGAGVASRLARQSASIGAVSVVSDAGRVNAFNDNDFEKRNWQSSRRPARAIIYFPEGGGARCSQRCMRNVLNVLAWASSTRGTRCRACYIALERRGCGLAEEALRRYFGTDQKISLVAL
jgi:hypothetical protein